MHLAVWGMDVFLGDPLVFRRWRFPQRDDGFKEVSAIAPTGEWESSGREADVPEISRFCHRARLMDASPGLLQECAPALLPETCCHLSSVPRGR